MENMKWNRIFQLCAELNLDVESAKDFVLGSIHEALESYEKKEGYVEFDDVEKDVQWRNMEGGVVCIEEFGGRFNVWLVKAKNGLLLSSQCMADDKNCRSFTILTTDNLEVARKVAELMANIDEL